MKRKKGNLRCMAMFAAVLAAAGFLCTGCGKGKTPEGENPAAESEVNMAETEVLEETAEETEEPADEMSVEVSEETQEQFTNDNGELLLTSTVNNVSVHLPGNQEAETSVNSFFTDRSASYEDTIREYCDMAQEELTWRGEEGLSEDWEGYGLGRTYSVVRADEKMICILETSYEYTGGAHPNSACVAYNFDTGSGARLTLADVADDLDEIQNQSVEYLRETLPESEYADLLFDDYGNHLEDILTDATWYTDENGFHIICNEYIITPHAAGILDFVLPYEKTAVSEKYIPEQGGAAEAADGETAEPVNGETETMSTDDRSE